MKQATKKRRPISNILPPKKTTGATPQKRDSFRHRHPVGHIDDSRRCRGCYSAYGGGLAASLERPRRTKPGAPTAEHVCSGRQPPGLQAGLQREVTEKDEATGSSWWTSGSAALGSCLPAPFRPALVRLNLESERVGWVLEYGCCWLCLVLLNASGPTLFFLCAWFRWMGGCRSSSDDSAVGGGDTDIGGGRPPPPEAISLDRSFNTSAEEFTSAWESLRTCASFRYQAVIVWPAGWPWRHRGKRVVWGGKHTTNVYANGFDKRTDNKYKKSKQLDCTRTKPSLSNTRKISSLDYRTREKYHLVLLPMMCAGAG